MELRNSIITIWNWLRPRERILVILLAFFQVALGVLDLLAVGIIGVLTSISSRRLTNKDPGDSASEILEFLRLDGLEVQKLIAVLGATSFFLLILKSMFSYVLTRKSINFLARKNSELSNEILQVQCFGEYPQIYKEVPENVRFNVIDGSSALMIGVLGGFSSILTDIATLLFLFVGMTLVSPLTALMMFSLFTCLVLFLTRVNYGLASRVGEEFVNYSKEGNEIIFQTVLSYRELYVAGLVRKILQKFNVNRKMYAKVVSSREMIPFQGKYIFEVAALVVSFGVLALQLSISETTRALAIFAIFFSATFRIAPSSMRIYQGISTIRINKSIAASSKDVIQQLGAYKEIEKVEGTLEKHHLSYAIKAKSVTFRHSDSQKALFHIDLLEINPREFVGIEGKSGVGKSTLLDVILGVREPSEGEILIGETNAVDAIRSNPGLIAYVPQKPFIINGTVRENLTYGGLVDLGVNDEILMSKLRLVGMFRHELNKDFLDRRAMNLSGGQIQRLALARALISDPKILVLDEPTSSLDAGTQVAWNKLFKSLTTQCSLLVVSHQHEVLHEADKIYSFTKGKLKLRTH